MSAHKAIAEIAIHAQGIAEELHVERKRRLAAEAENEDLKHTLRSVEISLHSNAPLDALHILKPVSKRKTH